MCPALNSTSRPQTDERTAQPSRPADPASEYRARLEAHERGADDCRKWDSRIAAARGLTFLAALAALIYVFNTPQWSVLIAAVPVLVFAVLVVVHNRVVRGLENSTRAVAYYQRCLDRLADRWMGTGATGDRYQDPHHVYTGDLDIFGKGSLFQLLSIARTRLGEDTLARWLSSPADLETVRRRQSAVAELRSELDLREEFALLDAEVHEHLDQNQLVAWAGEPPQPIPFAPRLLGIVLAAGLLLTVLGWAAGFVRITPLVALAATQLLVLFAFRRHIRNTHTGVERAASGLAILSQVLRVIEHRSFACAELTRLRSALEAEGRPPSLQIARLKRLVEWLNNCLQNQFFAPIAFMLCLPVHVVHAIETWRAECGVHIPEWLVAVGEFEALGSLAGYSYERPEDPFPELVSQSPLFDAQGLGHPLIPRPRCVTNEVFLGDQRRLLMVSGSNMSGKSTLLRAVGVNAVLAQAGAPVRAASLRMSPVLVGAAMRVGDSLQEAESLFYAVISRIKQVVELTGKPQPLLFLLDEILQGTNSHDRRVGAERIIRQLLRLGAFGLVTTHDLALTEIVGSLGDRAVNIHFEDRLVDGRMEFDYRIRPGVVERSNALELMRMVGLPVADDTEQDLPTIPDAPN